MAGKIIFSNNNFVIETNLGNEIYEESKNPFWSYRRW